MCASWADSAITFSQSLFHALHFAGVCRVAIRGFTLCNKRGTGVKQKLSGLRRQIVRQNNRFLEAQGRGVGGVCVQEAILVHAYAFTCNET